MKMMKDLNGSLRLAIVDVCLKFNVFGLLLGIGKIEYLSLQDL
jgi:hypothetical protein